MDVEAGEHAKGGRAGSEPQSSLFPRCGAVELRLASLRDTTGTCELRGLAKAVSSAPHGKPWRSQTGEGRNSGDYHNSLASQYLLMASDGGLVWKRSAQGHGDEAKASRPGLSTQEGSRAKAETSAVRLPSKRVLECLAVALSLNAQKGFRTIRRLSGTLRAVSEKIEHRLERRLRPVPNRVQPLSQMSRAWNQSLRNQVVFFAETAGVATERRTELSAFSLKLSAYQSNRHQPRKRGQAEMCSYGSLSCTNRLCRLSIGLPVAGGRSRKLEAGLGIPHMRRLQEAPIGQSCERA